MMIGRKQANYMRLMQLSEGKNRLLITEGLVTFPYSVFFVHVPQRSNSPERAQWILAWKIHDRKSG
jgi:hypothetical protein